MLNKKNGQNCRMLHKERGHFNKHIKKIIIIGHRTQHTAGIYEFLMYFFRMHHATGSGTRTVYSSKLV